MTTAVTTTAIRKQRDRRGEDMSRQPWESRILDGPWAGFKTAGMGGLLGDTVATREWFEDVQRRLFFSAFFPCFRGEEALQIL